MLGAATYNRRSAAAARLKRVSMAFSGQYAAAQLHKLDGLLRCHFALAEEIAEYLGFS